MTEQGGPRPRHQSRGADNVILRKPLLVILISGLLAFALAACGSSNAASNGGSGGSSGSEPLVGAGSTFVAPLMSKWQSDYASKTGQTVTYGAIGSGGGAEGVTNRTVAFGASGATM